MLRADEVREQQRQTWDRFSPGWMKWDALVMGMLAPVGAEMIRALAPRDGSEHLDVASGTGEPGLSIAALVPRGRVVLTDLSGGMLAVASANASALGLTNAETRQCGADDLPFGDASLDTISCRFGFMFFPDIAGAVTELLRVLRPGGRISAAVWAGPPGNPWATIPLAAISAEVDMPAPPPEAPGLFRCARRDRWRVSRRGDARCHRDRRARLPLPHQRGRLLVLRDRGPRARGRGPGRRRRRGT
jgi:ubiquinone/menaquinone biosynthesis C-methylase UbiE